MSEKEQLERVLRSGRAELRRFALERMVSLGQLPDTALLEQLCNDGDAEVRALAAQTLGSLSAVRSAAEVEELQPEVPTGKKPFTSPRFRLNELKAAAMKVLQPCLDGLIKIARHDDDHDVARQAVAAIGRLRDWSTIDVLIELLQKEHLIADAALSLAAIGDLRGLRPVIEAVRNSTDGSKTIILALASFKTRDSMLQLIQYLHGTDSEMRAQAALSLREHASNEEVREALLEILGDDERSVVVNSLLALKGCDDEEVIGTLVDLFGVNSDEHVRATIMSALHGATHLVDEVVDVVQKALQDNDSRVRANAVECLSSIKIAKERRAALLSLMVKDDDNRVRGNVALGFGSIDPTVSLDIMRTMLKSEDKWVRASAVYVGRFIKDKSIGDWLLSVLATEKDEDVVRNAVSSLYEHRASALTDDLMALLAHETAKVRAGAVEVLAGRDEPQVASKLVRHYEGEKDSSVRAEIVAAIGKLRAYECSSFLLEALKEKDINIQIQAIEALDALGRLETVPAMVPYLHSGDNKLRASAIMALWHQGCLMVVEAMVNMLQHPAKQFRLSAINALELIGDELPSLGKSPRTLHLCSALMGVEEDDFPTEEATPEVAPEKTSPPPPSAALSPIPFESEDDFAPLIIEEGEVAEAPVDKLIETLDFITQGATEKALTNAEQLRSTYGEDGAVGYLIGLCHLKSSNKGLACQALEGIKQMDETFFPASVEAAGMKQGADDAVASYGLYLKAFRQKLKFVEGLVDHAEELLREKRLVDLSGLIREMLAVEPLERTTYQRMGLVHLKLKDYERARRFLRYAFVMQPNNTHVQFNLALCCFHLKYFDECKALAERILATAKESAPERQRASQLLSLLP
mgnify:CR=1 FL=1